uniref:HisA/HisF-related TIM barrel protein n=1 Tax=Algoriphagus sp. TaxID=1872435 RepID=UPI004048B241
MLRKRLIFSLIYNDGYFMQSRNFRLQKVGDLNWLEKNYKFRSIASSLDELVVLDASRSNKDIYQFASVITKLVSNVFIPIAAGGGISKIEDAELLFSSGADKLILNSSLFEYPLLVKDLVKKYGSQSIIASIDYRNINGDIIPFINNGTNKIKFGLNDYLDYLNDLDVGEIFLNSIDKDGTGFGYDLKLIEKIESKVTKPLIISGGAGNEKHFLEGLSIDGVSGVSTANLFNFIGEGLPNARRFLHNEGINLAKYY